MVCMVVAEAAHRRTAWLYRIEDLGPHWQCLTAGNAQQALQHLEEASVQAVILCPGQESRFLLQQLTARPPLSPPYLLGDGCPAPDGSLPDAEALPRLLAQWRAAGQLPALCGAHMPEAARLASGLLHTLASPPRLRAWAFLPEMAALTVVHPPLLTDLAHGLYPLIARRHGMTPAAVERSLRLFVESTWSRGSLSALDRFFGCSVDPERGKPTNREFLCRLQERLTLSMRRLM